MCRKGTIDWDWNGFLKCFTKMSFKMKNKFPKVALVIYRTRNTNRKEIKKRQTSQNEKKLVNALTTKIFKSQRFSEQKLIEENDFLYVTNQIMSAFYLQTNFINTFNNKQTLLTLAECQHYLKTPEGN